MTMNLSQSHIDEVVAASFPQIKARGHGAGLVFFASPDGTKTLAGEVVIDDVAGGTLDVAGVFEWSDNNGKPDLSKFVRVGWSW